jgi:hypothetical protein
MHVTNIHPSPQQTMLCAKFQRAKRIPFKSKTKNQWTTAPLQCRQRRSAYRHAFDAGCLLRWRLRCCVRRRQLFQRFNT